MAETLAEEPKLSLGEVTIIYDAPRFGGQFGQKVLVSSTRVQGRGTTPVNQLRPNKNLFKKL